MNVVYLVLIYGFICFCMIFFNIGAIIYGKGSNTINSFKNKKYKKKIKEQLARIEEGLEVDEEHIKYLVRKLRRASQLYIYDSIITSYQKRENKYVDEYLIGVKSAFIELLYIYEKRNVTERAFFFSILGEYNLLYHNKIEEVDRILFDALSDDSSYCRNNGFLAICRMGNPYKLKDALVNITTSSKFFHKHIVSTGFNIYNGSSNALIKVLMKNFNSFRDDLKCCVIEYLSYCSNEYSEFVLEILKSSDTDRILRLSCLRYFEYVYYEEAEEVLVSYVNKYFKSNFEYCLYAVKALRNYNSEKSINSIKKAIYSDNFKIRDMACESLAVIRLGFHASEIDDFVLDEDVNDIYNYHMRKNMKKTVK